MIKYLSSFTKFFAILYITWTLFCVLVSLFHYENGYFVAKWIYYTGFPFSIFGNVMDEKGSVLNILIMGFFGLIQWIVVFEMTRLIKKK